MKPHDEWNSADAALAEMGGVRVVPLKWDEDRCFGWKRGRIVGLSPRGKTEATIFRVAGGWQYMGDVYLAAHDSLDAALDRAKAAAQADYEARILAAIEPAPVSVREAARVLLDWTAYNVHGAGQDFADDLGEQGLTALRAIGEGEDT